MSSVSGPSPSPRLVSLDALRGFDMFWILGANALVHALDAIAQTSAVRFLSSQLWHTPWTGFTFYDLICPLFVFITGVSMVFSLPQRIARDGRAAAVRHILWRAALLYLLGIFYNSGFAYPWPNIRLTGVLHRIALSYAAAGLLFCFFKPRALAGFAGAILAGYWALLTFVPIRNIPLDHAALATRLGVADPSMEQVRAAFEATTQRVTGHFEPGLNLVNHFDFLYLPGKLLDRYYDPEGVLSSLPAVATCLLGVLAGVLLRRADLSDRKKLGWLLAAGAGALATGWLWHAQFPVIKKLWTSSYVLVAGGWSLLLLATFYYFVDVRQWRRWCQPFVWIGMNPITLYLATALVDFEAIAARLVGGSVKSSLDAHVARGSGQFLLTLTSLALVFALAGFLHRRKIFLRV